MAIRLYDSLSRELRELKPGSRGRCLPLLQLRSDRLRPRAHRQFPHVRRQRRHPPPARARIRRREGASRPQSHRRRRQDHPPGPQGGAAARGNHAGVDREVPRGLRRAQLPAPARGAHRHRPHRRAGRHDRPAGRKGARLCDAATARSISRWARFPPTGASRASRSASFSRRTIAGRRGRCRREGGRQRLRAVEGVQARRTATSHGTAPGAVVAPAGTSSAAR